MDRVNRRPLQFSLRGLLGLVLLACLGLGAGHLIKRYCQFIEVQQDDFGIVVNAQCVSFFGPAEKSLALFVKPANGQIGPYNGSYSGQIPRRWLCVYAVRRKLAKPLPVPYDARLVELETGEVLCCYQPTANKE